MSFERDRDFKGCSGLVVEGCDRISMVVGDVHARTPTLKSGNTRDMNVKGYCAYLIYEVDYLFIEENG